MAKAWRNESAAKINARRAACRQAHEMEPTARVQKNAKQAIQKTHGGASFLLAGMLQRIGLWYNVDVTQISQPGVIQRTWQAIRKLFR